MMREWKEYRLDQITEPLKETYNPDGSDDYAYIGLEHIEPKTLRLSTIGKSSDVTSNKFRFDSNDILFGKLRPYFRKVVKPKFPGICSTDIWVFRAKENIDQDFLYFFLANWDFVNTANGADTGTRMPRADWSFLKSTQWNIPSLSEQQSIASILSSLDDKIDLLQRQNKTIEQLTETLFRQWFVVEADQSWEVGTLASIVFFSNGKARPKEEGLIPIYGGNGILGYTNQYNYSGQTIIIGRVGAYAGSLFYENQNIWVSDNALVAKGIKKIYNRFIFFILKTLDLNSMTEGSSHPLITQTLLKSIEIIIPPAEKIEIFDTTVGDLQSKIEINNTKIKQLTQLRDTLLPKLMSGEVRINIH